MVEQVHLVCYSREAAKDCIMLARSNGQFPEPLTIDSGAAETVLPKSWFLDYDVAESAGSRNGQHYVAANGDPIYNEGQKVLVMSDSKGRNVRGMQIQVCDVTNALGSVMNRVKNGTL